MAISNTSKPTTSITNTAKVSFAELWDTISTSWNSETRTWDDCISLIDNISRVSTSVVNTAKPS